MNRVKTFLGDGSNPNGRIFAGDLNAIQDAVAALNDLTQSLGVGSIALGESGLQFVRYGSLEARITGALRTDGLLRGLGGIIPGAFTTSARNAIATGVGLAPYGTLILNTTTNQYEWNKGDDTTRNWQATGSLLTSGIDVLANQPAASAVASGSTFWATDQVVEYVSNGTTWLRKGLPAGATVSWFNTSAPTGWVTYDGGVLPDSTGIYADLYTHLGSTTTKPDTRGRSVVGQGSHADVDAILDNDGVTLSSRTPKHNSVVNDTGHFHDVEGFDNIGDDIGIQGVGTSSTHNSGTAAVPTDTKTTGITVGPGGSRPSDLSPWIVALKIAKL